MFGLQRGRWADDFGAISSGTQLCDVRLLIVSVGVRFDNRRDLLQRGITVGSINGGVVVAGELTCEPRRIDGLVSGGLGLRRG
jgi:hypothetical protein